MAQGITGSLPNFNSNNDVLPYLIAHRNHLTMAEIIYACDWALDPGFIQRDAITQFMLTLPIAQQHQLEDDECPLCCSPYEADSNVHFPIQLPCGHILGDICLGELLKDSESCLFCRATIFTRPAAAPPLANRRSEDILRGLLQSGNFFLTETTTDSRSEKSFAAFCSWAHGRGGDNQSIIARLVATEKIGQMEFSMVGF